MKLLVSLHKYKGMILTGLFFFYLGCGLTISLVKLDCSDAFTSQPNTQNEHSTKIDQIEYVILILTTANNIQKRDAIRMTWLNLMRNVVTENGEKFYKWNVDKTQPGILPKFVKPFFSIGVEGLNELKLIQLDEENQKHGDLLFLIDFKDEYEKLADKMLRSLKWLKENVPSLKYVVKCDDDSFVRIDKIIGELEAYGTNMQDSPLAHKDVFQPPFVGLYWGYFDGRAKPKLKGKWREKNWFLSDYYLPYTLGGGYVLSNTIVHYLADNSHLLNRYISEDVSMGVWTSSLSNINRLHDIRFDTEWISRGCQNDQLVRHKQSPTEMRNMMLTLERSGGLKLCKEEIILKPSYNYNWSAPPSLCCKNYQLENKNNLK